MVSVAFEKFLPTDTVVDVPEILNSYPDYPTISVLVGLGAAFTLAVLFCASQGVLNKVERIWVGLILGILAVVAVVTLIFVPVHGYNADKELYDKMKQAHKQLVEYTNTENRDNLSANIMSVYDVDRVEVKNPSPQAEWNWNTGLYEMDKTVMPSKTSSVKAVIFKDGTTYDVVVSQNPDTYEPLLSVGPLDTPIRKK